MARNPSPSPVVTAHWSAELARLAQAAQRRKDAAQDAQHVLHTAVREAFSQGVLVGAMIKATGLSGSRLFQIKHAKLQD